MNGSGTFPLQTAGRVLRAEGWAALRERVSDRLRDSLRRRSFRAAASLSDLPPIPVLNLLSTVPTPRLGGMQMQLLTRMESETRLRPLALLYPEAESYRLEISAAGRRLALGLGGGPPPSPAALRDAAFERTAARAAAEVGASALHVEGLWAMPLASLLELHRSGLALILSIHDFSLFCPRPHLLEVPQLRFCHYSRDPERCARCLGQDWPVELGFQEERREIARELLQAAAAVVYPSEFLRRRHLELFPGLPVDRQRVIEPASTAVTPAPAWREGPVRHVAYVGQVQPHKGALVFEETVRRLPPDAAPALRWSAYGGGDPELLRRLRQLPRVRVHGYYRSGSLVDRLRRDRVDLALLLSVWPESYNLALSECRMAGVPVLAFDHGAIGDRIHRDGGGLLVDPALGAKGVAALLREMIDGRRTAPREPPPGAALPSSADDAAGAFADLYRELGLR